MVYVNISLDFEVDKGIVSDELMAIALRSKVMDIIRDHFTTDGNVSLISGQANLTSVLPTELSDTNILDWIQRQTRAHNMGWECNTGDKSQGFVLQNTHQSEPVLMVRDVIVTTMKEEQ